MAGVVDLDAILDGLAFQGAVVSAAAESQPLPSTGSSKKKRQAAGVPPAKDLEHASPRTAKCRPRHQAAEDPEAKGQTPPKKKLRQALESFGSGGCVEVEVLCPQCRRDGENKRQMSLSEMFGGKAASSKAPVDLTGEPADVDPTVCRRCRRSLVVDHMTVGKARKKVPTGCVFTTRLKGYKRNAVETKAQWHLTDAEAMALMRQPCALCGVKPDLEAGRLNGITRLRAIAGSFGMGPYQSNNVATACTVCNSLKGVNTLIGAQEVCRTIATHRGLGAFGAFPERFRNNISRKSRSSYLGDTARKPGGTVASKTHCLSNADFARIVAQPCHYCGKATDPPKHYNGLDRLDNSLRVYTMENAVSCCSTCNMAKGKFAEAHFLDHCRIVAQKAVEDGPAPGPSWPAGASQDQQVEEEEEVEVGAGLSDGEEDSADGGAFLPKCD